MNNSDYTTIIRRIERLEEAIFGETSRTQKSSISAGSGKFSGATGGIRFLILRGFFSNNNKRSLSDVRKELEKHDYPYSSQAVDMALRRLAKVKGPLVALKPGAGKQGKLYAKRK